MSPRYTPGGRAHGVMSVLAETPMGRRGLERFADSERSRRKLPYVLAALAADDLIYRDRGVCHLTEAGWDLLSALDEQVGPSIRVFRSEAA